MPANLWPAIPSYWWITAAYLTVLVEIGSIGSKNN